MDICPITNKICNNIKNITFFQNVNGEQVSCCSECINVSPLLQNLFKLNNLDKELYGERCKTCQISLNEIKIGGKLGCGDCYESFRKELEPIIILSQNNNKQHFGKFPKNNLKQLEICLKEAIQAEHYEEAAELRDKIKELKKIA